MPPPSRKYLGIKCHYFLVCFSGSSAVNWLMHIDLLVNQKAGRRGICVGPGPARLCITLISSEEFFGFGFCSSPPPPPHPGGSECLISMSWHFVLPLVVCLTAERCGQPRQGLNGDLAVSVYASWSVWACGHMKLCWEPAWGAEPGEWLSSRSSALVLLLCTMFGKS